MNNYQVSIYPSNTANPTVTQSDSQRADIAVCFSGGGSRALSCAWGQMLGLTKLTNQNGQPLMDRVRYISSVSGGTWASVLYCFRPENITDEEFLGANYSPSLLYYNQDVSNGMNLSKMGAFALGKVPQNFVNLTEKNLFENIIFDFIADSLLKGIPLNTSAKWLWMYIVGENVLADFGLYTFKNSIFKSKETPWNYTGAKFFSLSQTYAAQHIFSVANAPPQNAFVYARTNKGESACPMLIMNTNVVGKAPALNYSGPIQIPTQVSPVSAGIYGQNPCVTDDIGGGSVESFAFTSNLESAQDKITAGFSRAYSLVDIAACSSAFYAATLATPLQSIMEEMQNMTDEEMHRHFSKFLHEGEELIIKELREKISHSSNQLSGVKDLVPQYNYWPVSSATEGASANRNTEFTDGGDLENTGVAGLLAQVQGTVSNIISFVNGAEVLEVKNGQIIAATQMAPLFGIAYDATQGLFKNYLANGVNPFTNQIDPCGFLQVFDNSQNQFDALRNGLYQANGENQKSNPAFFFQTLTLVENVLLGINKTRSVNLLWVQNAVINNWQQKIVDPLLKEKIQTGQAKGGNTEFANFPYYSTSQKIAATAAETNALAQMWSWSLIDTSSPLRKAIDDIFALAEVSK